MPAVFYEETFGDAGPQIQPLALSLKNLNSEV